MADIIQIKVSATGVTPAIKKLTQLNELLKEIRANPVTLNTTGITRGTEAIKGFSSAAGTAGKQVTVYTKNVSAAEKQHQLLGASLSTIAAKMFVWQVMGTLVSGVIGSFKEAVQTMKAVDDELVVVRKVTGATASELKVMEEQAYKTASAYGVAADEYLESVAAFARAGYDDQSSALAELAVKTQLVGDTDAETAQQFLLSVDAAYKYKGSVEELTAVLDGANEIDNNYATSIEKVAEGLGKVAPIASQAHVGVDELSAAIGTITAVTQRSGTEASTALRALFLNIMGDTKTEIDEGVTWTTGEIEGLRDVIKLYASDVYEAAQISGEVINPMEAIAALAKSMKENILTEQKLVDMVSDIGGKLRTTQLLALIQNWDMYESMLTDYQNAVGSADKEVENAMDSWTRKTEVLKNTWTEYISHLVETDTIKGSLDVLTGAVELLDSDAGRAVVTIGALTGAVALLGKGASALKASNLGAFFSRLTKDATRAGSAVELLSMTFLSSPLFAITAGTAAIYGLAKYIEKTSDSFENQRAIAEELTSQLAELSDEYNTLKERMDDGGEGLTGTDRQRLILLEERIKALEEDAKKAKQDEYEAWASTGDYRKTLLDATKELYGWRSDEARSLNALTGNESVNYIDFLIGEYEKYIGVVGETVEADNNLINTRETIVDQLTDYATQLNDYIADGVEVSEADRERYDWIMNLIAAMKLGGEAGEYYLQRIKEGATAQDLLNDPKFLAMLWDTAEATAEESKEMEALRDAIGGVAGELDGATKAKEKFDNALAAGEKDDAFKDYAEALETLQNEIGAGRINSNSFWAAAEMLLGTDELEDLEYNAQAVIDKMTLLNRLFGDADSSGTGLVSVLQDMADDSGKVYDELGRVVATINEANGSVEFSIENMEALADMLGVSEGGMWSLVSALHNFGDVSTASTDDLLAALRDVGVSITTLESGVKQIDFTQLVYQLAQAGASSKDIYDIKTALEEADGVELTNIPESISDVMEKAQETKDEAGNAKDAISALDDISLNRLDDRLETVRSALIKVWSAAEKAGTGISGLNSINLPLSDGLKQAYAGGTDGAKEGDALVNENGPELIREGDKAFIAGGGRPTIIRLKRGAQVFTAEETAAILNNRAVSGSISAYADGAYGTITLPGGKTTVSGNTVTTAAAASGDTQEALEKEIELLKSELDLMEKQGKSVEERKAKMREIQDALHREAEYLRSIGAEQTEINKLSSEWWDIQKDILALQDELWDELEEAVSEKLEEAKSRRDEELAAIDAQIEALKEKDDAEEKSLRLEELRADLLEKQNDLLDVQKERTVRIYNAATGQWEWIADAGKVKSAQEALENARKSLSDYEKEIALDEAVAELEARKELIEAHYDELEAEWDEIIKSIEEPGRDIADILEDIAENGAPLMKEQVDGIGAMLTRLSSYIESATTMNMVLAGGIGTASDGAYRTGYDSFISGAGALRPASTVSTVNNRSGNDYYYGGTYYNIGGVSLSASEAAGMSVAQLAARARTLSVYKNM